MSQFRDSAELERWLGEQGVDLTQWGHNGSKSVDDLYNEIAEGETWLQGDPPLRHVEAVRVIVRRADKILIEAGQVFHDGRMRTRNRPPSEKLHPGENPLLAAQRCLEEELAVPPEAITLYPDSYREQRDVLESASYPGLLSSYHFHVVEATVEGLPDEPFFTVEQAVGPGEPVSHHFWEWQEESQ